ncbi:macrophage mannose receptor 1-like [Triplophysa dalaica]|uniref:macrophage mannose receptor 1-like n=1 Tax=Triplophysa dalaica TaxID=1582913 RepID=UPI0024DF4C84|nr:macrophage mannose receptor 1-like [Triplophysa dalaica]
MAVFPLRLFSGFTILALCAALKYIFVNEKKTWTEAQSYCRDKYTDLVTVENEQAMEKLLNIMDNYNSIDLTWIGLYDDLNSWKWTLEDKDFFKEGEKLFRNWNNPGPGNNGEQSLCVNIENGRWIAKSCSTAYFFVCYDGRVNASESYVPVSQSKSWTQAQSYCRQHHSDLVSVKNESENQKILYLLQNYYDSWIDLYRTRSRSDQSNSTFINWMTGEPNNAGNSENCTAVSFSDAGEWTEQNCNYQLPFICYSATALESRQYHFISVNKSWSEAQTYCRQNYTDLATIDNRTEMNSVMNTVNGSYNGSAWIGQYDEVNSWRLSLDDSGFYQEGEREFKNWNHQPDNYRGNELCVYMDVEDGSWFDSSCDNTLPFVCFDGRENATQRYIKVTARRTWTEARRYCREHHTDLVNMRNLTENQRFISSEGGVFWIGLYRNRIWSNHALSSYQNWKPEGFIQSSVDRLN